MKLPNSRMLCCLSLLLLALVPVWAETYYLVQLQTDDYRVLRAYLEMKGYDVAGYNAATRELGVVTTEPKQLEQLRLETADRPALCFTITSAILSRPYRVGAAPDGIADYYDVEETVLELQKLEQSYPQWAKLYNLNHYLGVPATQEGRYIYGLQVSINPHCLEDEPKAMFVGVHHAREITTHHSVIDAAKEFLQQAAGGNPSYRDWLEKSAVWFVPVANPDGMAYVFAANNMWRKNRSRNADGSSGVDLNRNYAFKWGICGSNSTSGSSDIYRGPSAFSEPESKLMDKLNAKLHFQFIVSYHSYGNEVLYPYLCATFVEPKIYQIRDALALELGFDTRTASSSGEDFEHHYNQYGSIAYLLELGNTFQPSFADYTNKLWPVVKKTLPFIMRELHQPHVYIKITDAGGQPLPATLVLQEIQFKEGEKREADAFGSYRWYLPAGEYHFTASLNGYQSKSFTVSLGAQTVESVVQLDK